MSSRAIPDLISLVGLLMAMALYAMLLAMVVRDQRSPRVASGGAPGRLPFWTAVLGLAWNIGALALFHSPAEVRPLSQVALTIAFSALGFLPALFVDVSLRPWGAPAARAAPAIRTVAYALAIVAAALHAVRALSGLTVPSPLALRVLAIGYWLLVPALFRVAPRGARVQRGLVTSAALLAFGVCALHLAGHVPGHDTWTSALFGHNASLPLVLAILYEDYRFAFADIFLKRALALIVLVSVVLGLYLVLGGVLIPARDETSGGILLVLWVGTALAYPVLQRLADRFVDVVVLRRPDYARLRNEIAAAIAEEESPEEVLGAVTARLAPALSAQFVSWSEDDLGEAGPAPGPISSTVSVPTSEPPSYVLHVGQLSGGRRLLSDDSTLLDAVALLAARRIDSLRITRERWQRDVREQEISRLATEAELKALQAQLNPHFLFNALNTIGYLMRAAPDRATATLLDLTHLLRAVLKRAGGDFVTLGQELELVGSYLAIESARFEERLTVKVQVPESLRTWAIPPLVIQPLVENAIKHGIAPNAEGGTVAIAATTDGPDVLVVTVADSGRGSANRKLALATGHGVGLANIERRLAAYYGDTASVVVARRPEGGTLATVRIPAASLVPASRARA